MPRAWIGAVMLVSLLAGCSADIGSINLLPKLETFTRPASLSYSAVGSDLSPPPVGANELVNQDGQCPAVGPDGAAAAPAEAAGEFVAAPVALQMSECEVVRRAGAPDKIDVGSNERRQRSVVLTYMHGSRPGTYTFADGRLVSIEALPGAPAPAKPQKPAKTAKKKPAAT